jgi:dihydroneopterin aldolase
MCYNQCMTKLLEKAIQKVSALPEAAQESIAEDLIAHVENVEHLRAELQKGINSLDRDQGQDIDIEQLIKVARTEYERQ